MRYLKESLSNILYFPVEVILLLLFRPLFADYFSIVLPAVLFFYTCVGLIFYLKLKNYSANIWKIIAIKYLALVILTFVYFYSGSLTATLFFGILFVLLFLLGFREKNLKAKLVRARLLLGAIIILLLPLIFILSQTLLVAFREKSITRLEYASFNNLLTENEKKTSEKLDLIANDPMIADYLEKNDYADLLNYSQNILVAHSLSYFVITSADGTVLVKTHDPSKIGNNLFKLYPPAGQALANNHFSGISSADEASPYQAVGKAIKKDDSVLGTVFVGNFINDAFLSNLPKQYAYVLASKDKFTASNDNLLAKNIFSSNNSKVLINSPSGFLRFQGKSYLSAGIALKDQTNMQIGTLLILRNDTLFLPALLILLAISTLVMIVYIVDIWPIAKIENLKLKHLDFISKTEKLLFCVPIVLIVLVVSLKIAINLNQSADSPTVEMARNVSPKLKPELSFKIPSPYAIVGKEASLDLYAISSGGLETESVVYRINFPADLIKVNSISASDVYCKQIVRKEIDNSQGTIDFACELPSLNSINEPRKMATINFVGVKPGVADITIDPSSSYILTAEGNSSNLNNPAQRLMVSASK